MENLMILPALSLKDSVRNRCGSYHRATAKREKDTSVYRSKHKGSGIVAPQK